MDRELTGRRWCGRTESALRDLLDSSFGRVFLVSVRAVAIFTA